MNVFFYSADILHCRGPPYLCFDSIKNKNQNGGIHMSFNYAREKKKFEEE